ncbi:hypothetical protein SUGI_0560420 [Cryptomeria japonica]|uniref:polyphenol oxidase I, chloroplastic n=1 Tax=Cryptomeria japonica TaxID=3369 RepID=UPI002408B3F9|nr:polyphenol oxidase I, chloroplastic [Cryptomeria japonica]GLJ28487.1 hypothetical protein SUGI_0560420 [Cryptomeria japonica]
MESAMISLPKFSHARSTNQWLPLDLKHQVLCPGKVRKTHGACAKNLASMRVRCENREDGRLEMDRRQLLLSSSTLGVSALTSGKAMAKPFPAPDLSKCIYPTDLPTTPCSSSSFSAFPEGGCCPPFKEGETAVDFEFPTSLPMRTRKAAHRVDAEFIEKYDKAVAAMKKLPLDDPRSFLQQGRVHCAYCNGAYKVGSDAVQVHKSWFFAPFHRWYIYFYERILASLIQDDTFALPFWNWDHVDGMTIPPMFTEKCRSLYNNNRDPCHQPPTLLNLAAATSCVSGDVDATYSNIYNHMVSGAGTAELFHGGPIRYEGENTGSTGKLEASPHNLVHLWGGSPGNPHREDIGSLYSAGKDPLFYSHHSNVDRMWFIWNTTLKNKNFDDKDLMETEFLFYDENKQLVKVKAGDCYDISKLRYQYEERELPWLTKGRSLKKAGKVAAKPRTLKTFEKAVDDKAKNLSSPLTFKVERPNKSPGKGQVEVLKIEGVETDRTGFSAFEIFINFPEANSGTPFNSPHYAGSFTTLGHGIMTEESMKSMTAKETFKIGISETLEDLGIENDDEILVTLVPKSEKDLATSPITFTSIKIEYVSK